MPVILENKQFFIAGTDTDAGKTLVACGLLRAAKRAGLRTLAVKPVAAGAEATEEGLRNDDALALMAEITEPLPYQQLNPLVFEPPIAPHIAAEQSGRRISAAQLSGFCRGVFMRSADLVLVEGAGGWRVPLNRRETLADLAIELRSPVILVVGMRLGCINHALLTAEAIRRDGLPLAGWVANQLQSDMACFEENLSTLQQMLSAPCLGVVPYLGEAPNIEVVADHLDIEFKAAQRK